MPRPCWSGVVKFIVPQIFSKRAILGFGLVCLVFLFSLTALAQTKAPSPQPKSNELRTAQLLEAARQKPGDLYNFLLRMPKGADLHNHLSGAVYAESLIQDAVEDRVCVNVAGLSLAKPTAADPAAPPACGNGTVPAANADQDRHLYDSLIDAFSMRGFVASSGVSGRDHFFDTFDRFETGALNPRHIGEWLHEAAARAASQNEQYLELMIDPADFSHTATIAKEVGWHYDFAQMRDELFAHGLRDDVPIVRAGFDRAEAARLKLENCGHQNELPACRVQIRYIYEVLRGFPKEQVFAQTLLGFETASIDPRVVGINYVMPEDGYVSMDDYALHMRIVGFLHGLYPKVHITLHAGELAPGLVPYEGLCCHIRLAVESAHAERIGHGVDVMYEDRPYELLKEMAARHVMVEINLTSNDVILGVSGKAHPLPTYIHSGVPVALSTDDEGVSRINLTHEYVRAVETYGLHYQDLKKMIRTGLEHSFLSGESLWGAPDDFARAASACAGETAGREKPSAGCALFLKGSEKAQQQWELERRFRAFESANQAPH
jgi:adenosine deaminase